MRKLPPLAKIIQRPSNKLELSVDLHELSDRLLRGEGTEALAERMLDALMEYHDADFGDVQLLAPDGSGLEIVAQRGFERAALSKTQNSAGRSHSQALKNKCPVVSEDIQSDTDLAPNANSLAKAGVRALQSTPLVKSDGHVIGVISTYFRKPHRLPVGTMQVTALFAQQGANRLANEPPHHGGSGAARVPGRRDGADEHHHSYDGEYAPFFRKVAQFCQLRADEIPVLSGMIRETRAFDADTEFVREGDSQDDCLIVLDGWGCKYKTLEDGTRQIIHFPILGDFVGVHARLFKAADHSFATITPSKLGVFSAERLQEVIQSHPRLGQAILWSAARDEAIMVEHLVNVGRRNAIQRLSHFLLEICKRMDFAGLGAGGDYRCPLTQEHLADALGLTSIHVNRVLRQLRERNLVSLEKGTLHIKDLSKLSELAAFDPDYLDQSN
ncbi:MAG: hypothetical protein CL608_03470 [Anaerolineaceae bacterium]|nr:hypothetical protein [Anaerolineaceae bacterium]